LADWRADQLVFLDESGINNKLGQRTHGWGPKGQTVQAKVLAGRAENLSLLPAMTVDGYIACNVYKGGVTADIYEEFVRDYVLPKCTPWPGPRSVIIMDNAKIHHETV
jgi:DDE superfamily endonuclease